MIVKIWWSACSLISHEDKCIAAGSNILIYKKWKSKTKTSHRPGTTVLDGTGWCFPWPWQGENTADQTLYAGASIHFLDLKSQFFTGETGPCIYTDVYTFPLYYINSWDFQSHSKYPDKVFPLTYYLK